MNDFQKYIETIIKINSKNDIYIKREYFINDNIIKELYVKYNYTDEDVEKFYKFTLSLIKIDNQVLKKFAYFSIVGNTKFCKDLFNAIKHTYYDNIDYLGNMYLNYLNRSFKYDKFIILVEKLCKFKEKITHKYIFIEKEENLIDIDESSDKHPKKKKYSYIIDDLGKFLYNQNLAEKKQIGNSFKYRLNDLGEKFYKMLFVKPTKKEIRLSSKLVNRKIMSKKMSVKKHKEYYKKVRKNLNSNQMYNKVAYIHEGEFKYFFNEYKVLIDYAITKYGEKCKLRFCGDDTNKTFDYDGVIKNNNCKEFVQITTISHDEEEKEKKGKLINLGCSDFKVEKLSDARRKVFDKVNSAIENKNTKLKKQIPFKLVVQVDCFDGYFIEDVLDRKYFSSIFDSLKNKEYKFKKIDLIVDRYTDDTRYIEPFIITIK